MSVDDDIRAFQHWAISLSCHPKFLPTDEALKSVFKSRQRDLLHNLIRYVRPRQIVQHIKENILIYKMRKIQDHSMLMQVEDQAFLPLQLQNYLKYCNLRDKEKTILEHLETTKKKYEALNTSIKERNTKILSLKHQCELREMKVHILQNKLRTLGKELTIEEEYKDRILMTEMATAAATEHVKNDNNGNDHMTRVMLVVQKALKKLQVFYQLHEEQQCKQEQQQKENSANKNGNGNDNDNGNENSDESPNENGNVQHDLWSDMKQLFKEIPNQILFDALLCLGDEQLQKIIQLKTAPENSDDNDKALSALFGRNLVEMLVEADLFHTSVTYSEHDVNLLECKSNIIQLVQNYLKAKRDNQNLKDKFNQLNSQFECTLLNKLKTFNTYGDDQDKSYEKIIQEFVVEYNKRNYLRGQNEFLQQQIDHLIMEKGNALCKLENHELLVQSVKVLYTKISSTIRRLKYEVAQLPQIRKRLINCKKANEYKLNNFRSIATLKNDLAVSKIKESSINICNSNMSFVNYMYNNKLGVGNCGGDIFETSLPDNVFCSTKLDFDTSGYHRSFNLSSCSGDFNAGDGEMPLISLAQLSIAPSHTRELQTFNQLPLEFFNCVPMECQLYLMPNPLIIESNKLFTTTQLVPGILLTPHGILEDARKRIMWANVIERHQANSLKLTLKPLNVDGAMLKLKAKQQNECISELLDNISLATITNQHLLQELNKMYDFLIDNPLRHFIPTNKLYNNRTYNYYESEFMMYYNMATSNN